MFQVVLDVIIIPWRGRLWYDRKLVYTFHGCSARNRNAFLQTLLSGLNWGSTNRMYFLTRCCDGFFWLRYHLCFNYNSYKYMIPNFKWLNKSRAFLMKLQQVLSTINRKHNYFVKILHSQLISGLQFWRLSAVYHMIGLNSLCLSI